MRKHLVLSSILLSVLLTVACEGASSKPPSSDAPAQDVQDTSQALTAAGCAVLTTAQVNASGDDGAGSVAANSQDDDLATRWSGAGKGAWLTMDLGSSQSLTGVAVAWHQGASRQNHFTLSTSEDGATFTQAYAGDSALSAAVQTYAFSAPRPGRYVRVTVNGNTVNDWASIAEARTCGVPPASAVDSGLVLPRLPYLQSVGPTSALVAFRSGVSCTPYVRFGPGSDLSRTATATAAGWRHMVKLDNLSPGQTYSYVVEACGSTTGVRQFRTASAAGTPRVHFTAMGDFGTGGSLQSQVLTRLAQAGRAGELLLALGDNAYSSGTEQEFQDRMFKPMAALLRQVPLFSTPGNHEYVTDQGQPYLDNLYMPANNPAGSERYYSFDWGPVHFVSLDSNCAIGLASADRCTLAAQKSWVTQDLASTGRPWKVVFFHHPAWSSGEHGSQLQMRREFAPLFEQYGVDLVLTGHDHNYERSKPMKGDAVAASGTRGIPYVVVGSGGATLRSFPGSQPSWTAYRNNTDAGYLSVVVDGGTLSAQFINPSGTVRDSFSLTKQVPASSVLLVPSSSSLETPPGPVDDPNHPPASLRFERELPPADRLEDVADLGE
ncbi:discoidin domain-containing protein [Stigmatella aurantiaca]|uniref:Metallophosphoesterase n=1 Tax=Stigmatella aurantiaca (strain DW4/3-1) TaxID=378806 RepID=Q09B27_STIAD|nr:discoidin domain-containing protein [Stigmatella aurantiaca]ADO69217.1 Metallophosphoesterase [Stigmatella aurantiaca DW4/3-1]EAU68934.1 Ser/Thr protein phosphatase family protein [Stigmatella aurantiaca DW4/3-1]